VLEAMASGTPVVTSNRTALPETAGNAALLVDPTSVEQIAEAIKKITTDTELRQRLRQNGLARAPQFSWGYTADMVRGILTQVAHHRAG
jgi:glycosyltransferase involved in cell wall biosynthesis